MQLLRSHLKSSYQLLELIAYSGSLRFQDEKVVDSSVSEFNAHKLSHKKIRENSQSSEEQCDINECQRSVPNSIASHRNPLFIFLVSVFEAPCICF